MLSAAAASAPKKKLISKVFIGIALLVNFVTAIAIVMLNKKIYSHKKVPPLCLMFLHFFCTFLGMNVLSSLGFYKVKYISILKVMPLCLVFCGFVVFSNLSLKYNTIGTYQILKCLADPVTLFLQVAIYGKLFNNKIKISLFAVVIGIIINYSTDIQINLAGTLFGLIAAVASSLYITWVGEKQNELQLSPPQLLFYQSSISSFFLLIIMIPVEYYDLQDYLKQLDLTEMMYCVASGLMAFIVNTSVFVIIKRTSVITYTVFCKLKICLVILGGYILFSEVMTNGQMLGIFTTLAGTFAYTYVKISEQKTSMTCNEENKIEKA